ncbi:hypothetical protein CDAR_41341 [Caerostris darwini]|uniref:Uncharacterized protein n=1 Tax=Caerostris darwini TaxID=1538125 RepID=A0AAV4SMX9_9ARAC|nr:hypothetical protein CDAR_41341 [Caerostris darwini]
MDEELHTELPSQPVQYLFFPAGFPRRDSGFALRLTCVHGSELIQLIQAVISSSKRCIPQSIIAALSIPPLVKKTHFTKIPTPEHFFPQIFVPSRQLFPTQRCPLGLCNISLPRGISLERFGFPSEADLCT